MQTPSHPTVTSCARASLSRCRYPPARSSPPPRSRRVRSCACWRSRSSHPRPPARRNRLPPARRRLGSEILDYAIDPFVAGIYAGNPGAAFDAGGVPASPGAGAEIWQRRQRSRQGHGRAQTRRRESEERRRQLLVSKRHADPDRCAGEEAAAHRVWRKGRARRARRGWHMDDRGHARRRFNSATSPCRDCRRAGIGRSRNDPSARPASRASVARDRLCADRRDGKRLPPCRRWASPGRLRFSGAEEGAADNPGIAVLEQHVRGPCPRGRCAHHHICGGAAIRTSRNLATTQSARR